MSGFGSEKCPEVSGFTGTALGQVTTYGVVLGRLHKGDLLSFGWGGWALG